jgi:HAE1 family hydrophobic/amphiphilic exporter-1
MNAFASGSLSDPFIRRPVLTVLLTISAILFGVLAYYELPVNDLPAVDYPVIQVTAAYPGASPETVANNVARPLEQQFSQISGLSLATSKSVQGFCSITLQFDLNKDIGQAATDVQTAISAAAGALPADLPAPPTYAKTNPNDQPIIYAALISNSVTQARLYEYASTIVKPQISTLSGVSQVAIFGTKSAIRVKADPSALAARGLSIDDVSAAIRANSPYSGAGQLDGPTRTFLLDPNTQINTAEGYNSIILGMRNDTPIYLRDVATATNSVQDERVNMRFWKSGREIPSATVIVAISRQAGANAVAIAKAIQGVFPAIQNALPASVSIIPIYDRSQSIVNSVHDVTETLVVAFILVVVVIFVFLGRATDTLIPVVALPLSLLLTFMAMNWLHYSVDNLSLMALTLAIGFLVDDAIVFLENTVRRMEHGESTLAATIHSAREISFTILSMTVSLAAVFLPLVFMPGLIGRIFHEFAMVIIISIIASGLVSLTVTPLMCSRLLRDRGPNAKKTFVERLISAVEKRTLKSYGGILWFFLRHRWISAVIWVVCMAGTVYLFKVVPKSFLPVGDSGFILGLMRAQEGTSPEQMRHFQTQMEKLLQGNPYVETTFTMTGNSQFLSASDGLVIAFLKDREQRPPIDAVVGEMIGQGMQIPGIMPLLSAQPVLQISVGGGSQLSGKYSFAISGVNADEVYAAADQIMAKFGGYQVNGGPGFQFFTSDHQSLTPKLQIDILRDQAASYGVSPQRILSLLRTAYSENYVYLIKDPGDQYQVILEAADSARNSPDDLNQFYVRSDDGQRLVPLKAVATWKQTVGIQAVNHINQFTSVTISYALAPGVNIGEANEYILKSAREVLPPTVRGFLQGEAETFRQTIPSLVVLMGLAVFVMYVILGILYESYLHPITVLSTLPVALVGGLGTLFLYNFVGGWMLEQKRIEHFAPAEASLYAFIGMFMLMGIVKKNGIMIVDFAIQRQAEGQPDDHAIHDASMDRFRPILMTTFAAVMGAVPIAIGMGADPESRRPLGLVIVGGLIVSQFITLFVTPVIYLYLEDFQEHVLDRIPFFRSSRTHRELQKQFEEFDAAEVRVAKAPHGSNGHAGTPAPQPPEHQHT